MEEIDSIGTLDSGETTIVTKSNIRLTLSPKAAQAVLDHLLEVSRVTATLNWRKR